MSTGRLALLALASVLIACGSPAKPPCECAAGEVCDATGQCVVPPSDSGTSCTRDSQCAAPSPRCLLDEGRCVPCLTDADCSVGTCDPLTHACLSSPDSCTSLRPPLDLSPGTLLIHGNTARAVDDTRLSCAIPGSVGADVVYALHVPRRGRLTALVRADPSSAFRPVVALRAACSAVGGEEFFGCSYATTQSRDATLTVNELAPGVYYLWIDGETEEGGPFDVELRLLDPQPVDSCSSPPVLRGGPGVEVIGDTSSLRDDAAASCGGRGAPDAVYALELTQPQRVRVEATGAGFTPVVYLRSTCDDVTPAKQLACAGGAPGSPSTVVDLPRVGAGTAWIYVDGPSVGQASGRFRLNVSTMEPVPQPTNDTCSSAIALPVPGGAIGRISAQGDTTTARNDAYGCQGSGPDLVYSLTLPEPRQVVVRVAPLAGTTFKPVVYLRLPGKCASEQVADHVTCVAAAQPGAAASFSVSRLGVGTYFIWVDGVGGTAGPFDLSVELSSPPPVPANDTCAAPTPIALASGPVTVTGTTAGANDDMTSCEVPGNAPDVAYTVTLPQAQSLAVDVRAASGSTLRPVVTLMSDALCVGSFAYAACGYPEEPVAGRSVLLLPNVPAGAYTLWVDGDYGTSGPFTLRVSSGQPVSPPSNDDCSASLLPALSSAGGAVDGDTRAAHRDNFGLCGGQIVGDDARDVAYSFQIASPRTVTLTVTPDAADGQLFLPVLYVQGPASGCTDLAPVQGCAVGTAYGAPVSLTLSNLPTGTYTLWVDGVAASAGRFTVAMQ